MKENEFRIKIKDDVLLLLRIQRIKKGSWWLPELNFKNKQIKTKKQKQSLAAIFAQGPPSKLHFTERACIHCCSAIWASPSKGVPEILFQPSGLSLSPPIKVALFGPIRNQAGVGTYVYIRQLPSDWWRVECMGPFPSWSWSTGALHQEQSKTEGHRRAEWSSTRPTSTEWGRAEQTRPWWKGAAKLGRGLALGQCQGMLFSQQPRWPGCSTMVPLLRSTAMLMSQLCCLTLKLLLFAVNKVRIFTAFQIGDLYWYLN